MTEEQVNQLITHLQIFITAETSVEKQAYLAQYPDIENLRREILTLARQYGAYNLRIFGSVARGEADSASDIDILVDLEAGRSLFDLGGLLMDLQAVLGDGVDVVTPNSLKPRIREQVLTEAKPL